MKKKKKNNKKRKKNKRKIQRNCSIPSPYLQQGSSPRAEAEAGRRAGDLGGCHSAVPWLRGSLALLLSEEGVGGFRGGRGVVLRSHPDTFWSSGDSKDTLTHESQKALFGLRSEHFFKGGPKWLIIIINQVSWKNRCKLFSHLLLLCYLLALCMDSLFNFLSFLVFVVRFEKYSNVLIICMDRFFFFFFPL